MSDAGGWLWLVIDVVLVAALAGGLIYGSIMWRRWKQHPRQAARRDEATRDLFHSER